MATEHIDVNYVADLARLELTPEEATTFQKQLDDILGYIDQLSELDVEGIEPTAHASPVFDRIREDVARPGLDRDAFLDNAPDTANDQLRVPKVIE
ncbi:aspartyl/glutamyl-tRNA(Asn/Gln) amidotransferase subunit C [Rubritalea squalenifaciens DSM 18772]|uniref:Aspartyl/glutamyl-tRNA(Asn/Gln) amidotransferase subunit C n=2 Tax=Rubritalea TaxID=361050 RepID=A0A1M6PT41_9BACT|nr:Asp-tRNA(Asn)/Glu-tRNA(Gln) amidotransferase subunit GatC [Rubritalea squalenifaciens]SHK11071.1 aspartyl/glutamyl-tRNA(Asn/Gln) amidotransferase subunit C [Rubritalea squalenifaciens DSM 18772]